MGSITPQTRQDPILRTPELAFQTLGLGFCQADERCSDGVEDQGADDVLWGRPRQESTKSVLERVVSRERLLLSASGWH
jgi:hypothetical protein